MEKIAKTRRKSTGTTQRKRSSPMEVASLLAKNENLSEPEIKKAIVMGILAEKFGEEFINDPNFLIMVDRISKMLADDAETDAVQRQVIEVLRESS